MNEDANASATEAQETAAQTPAADERKFTQKDLDGVVHKRVQQEREKYADYDDLKAKLATHEESSETAKTSLTAVTTERDELKGEVESTKLENTRLRVAMAKNVPLDLVDRLKGSTQEELEADADSLLGALKPGSGSFDGGARTTPKVMALSDESDPAKVREYLTSLNG